VAHCPLSNGFFAGGVLPVKQLLAAGVNVGLGTDVAGGYEATHHFTHPNSVVVVACQRLSESVSWLIFCAQLTLAAGGAGTTRGC
jgi:adenosine deaminase